MNSTEETRVNDLLILIVSLLICFLAYGVGEIIRLLASINDKLESKDMDKIL